MLICCLLLFSLTLQLIAAQNTANEILLQAVHKDTPSVERKKDRAYGPETSIKMVKLGESPNIKGVPPLKATVLHYGEVKLGFPQHTYGILIDFESQEKTVWPDSNGDKDYSTETSYDIFKSDRYTGGNIYYSPTPITFKINYVINGQDFSRDIQMDLPYLFIARAGSGDCFSLMTRTWFIGTFESKKGEEQIAVVDANDNGVYNDPDDMIFLDRNFDMVFSRNEGKKIKSFNELQLKDGKFKVDFSMCPVKLLLK